MGSRITIDPAVQCYNPFVYPGHGRMELKPFADDPRCLYGWHRCDHSWTHVCAREYRHPGRCWDGDETPCSYAQRPKNWDSKQRAECNR